MGDVKWWSRNYFLYCLLVLVCAISDSLAKNTCNPIFVRWPRVRLNLNPAVDGAFSYSTCKSSCIHEEDPVKTASFQQCSAFNHKNGPNTFTHHCQIYPKDQVQHIDGYVEADDRYSFYWKYCVDSERACTGDFAFTFLSDRYMAPQEVIRIYYSKTLEDCLAECLNEKSFLCRSVSFNRTDGGCHLSMQNQLSKPALLKLNNNPNFRIDYYENNCFNIVDSFVFDYKCEKDGIRLWVDSKFPYSGALYGLYDFFTCRIEPKEERKFEYLFPYPTISKNCSDSIRYKGNDMILEVVLSTDGVEPLYFITPDDLTYQARCPIQVEENTNNVEENNIDSNQNVLENSIKDTNAQELLKILTEAALIKSQQIQLEGMNTTVEPDTMKNLLTSLKTLKPTTKDTFILPLRPELTTTKGNENSSITISHQDDNNTRTTTPSTIRISTLVTTAPTIPSSSTLGPTTSSLHSTTSFPSSTPTISTKPKELDINEMLESYHSKAKEKSHDVYKPKIFQVIEEGFVNQVTIEMPKKKAKSNHEDESENVKISTLEAKKVEPGQKSTSVEPILTSTAVKEKLNSTSDAPKSKEISKINATTTEIPPTEARKVEETPKMTQVLTKTASQIPEEPKKSKDMGMMIRFRTSKELNDAEKPIGSTSSTTVSTTSSKMTPTTGKTTEETSKNSTNRQSSQNTTTATPTSKVSPTATSIKSTTVRTTVASTPSTTRTSATSKIATSTVYTTSETPKTTQTTTISSPTPSTTPGKVEIITNISSIAPEYDDAKTTTKRAISPFTTRGMPPFSTRPMPPFTTVPRFPGVSRIGMHPMFTQAPVLPPHLTHMPRVHPISFSPYALLTTTKPFRFTTHISFPTKGSIGISAGIKEGKEMSKKEVLEEHGDDPDKTTASGPSTSTTTSVRPMTTTKATTTTPEPTTTSTPTQPTTTISSTTTTSSTTTRPTTTTPTTTTSSTTTESTTTRAPTSPSTTANSPTPPPTTTTSSASVKTTTWNAQPPSEGPVAPPGIPPHLRAVIENGTLVRQPQAPGNKRPNEAVMFDIFHHSQPAEAVVVGSRITLSFTPYYAIPPSFMHISGCQVEPIASLYEWEKEPLAIVKDGCQADHVGLVCPPQKTDYGIRVMVEAFRYQSTTQVQYTCLIRVCPFAPCPQTTCPSVDGCPGESNGLFGPLFNLRSKRDESLEQLRSRWAGTPYYQQPFALPNQAPENKMSSTLRQQLMLIGGDHIVRKRLIVVNSEEELQFFVRTGEIPPNHLRL